MGLRRVGLGVMEGRRVDLGGMVPRRIDLAARRCRCLAEYRRGHKGPTSRGRAMGQTTGRVVPMDLRWPDSGRLRAIPSYILIRMSPFISGWKYSWSVT